MAPTITGAVETPVPRIHTLKRWKCQAICTTAQHGGPGGPWVPAQGAQVVEARYVLFPAFLDEHVFITIFRWITWIQKLGCFAFCIDEDVTFLIIKYHKLSIFSGISSSFQQPLNKNLRSFSKKTPLGMIVNSLP